MQVTRTRLLTAGAVGALMILLGLSLGLDPDVDHHTSANGLVDGLGLGLLVPAVTLLFAAGALGDLVDDGTLVYVWLRPLPRWKAVGAAMLVALSVCLPLTVIPVTLAAALAGGGADVTLGAAAASALGVAGYAGIFVGLGLVVQRALAWGFLYVLVWEGAVARIGTGPARLSIHLYARAVLTAVDGDVSARGSVDPAVGVPVVLAVAALTLALTAVRLARTDVA